MHPIAASAAKGLAGSLNRHIARVRFRLASRAAERPISLEIGGRAPRDGWLVTDVGALTRYYLDATRPWPFEDGALAHVFADNVLEHLQLDGGRRFLAEAHRCLRPGGVIRLVTPDMGQHIELYLAGASAVGGKVAARYRQMGIVVEHPIDLVRVPIGEFRHHEGYAYDFAALAAELLRAGFLDPSREAVGRSRHPDLVGLERRIEEGQAQLVVEAVR